MPGNVTILFPGPDPPPTRPPHPLLPKPPTSLAFPLAALGREQESAPTLGSGHPHQNPPTGAAPPAPAAFFTWLCKREGARRWGQCCPVRPPGAWALVWPAAPQLPAGGRACPQGGSGRCWACGSRYCSLHPFAAAVLQARSPKPRGSGRPGAGGSPKLAGPRAMVQPVLFDPPPRTARD